MATFRHDRQPSRHGPLVLPPLRRPPADPLVSLGRGGLRRRPGRRQAGAARHRRGLVPLVPRDGRRVLRGLPRWPSSSTSTSSASRWIGTSGPTWMPATSARSRRSPARAAGRSPPSSRPPAKCSTAGPTSRPTGVRPPRLPHRARQGARRATAPGGTRSTAQADAIRRRPRRRTSTKPRPARPRRRLLDGGRRQIAARVRSGSTAGSAAQPKFPHPGAITLPAAPVVRRTRADDAPDHRPDPGGDGAAAASTTSSAAGSIATAWTPSGSCPTSRRCPTTTRSCSRPISTRTRCSAPRSTPSGRGGIVRWVREVLADPEGGYAASQDADVGLDDDGDYFTWTRDEAAAALSPRRADGRRRRTTTSAPPARCTTIPAKNVLFVAAQLPELGPATRVGRRPRSGRSSTPAATRLLAARRAASGAVRGPRPATPTGTP